MKINVSEWNRRVCNYSHSYIDMPQEYGEIINQLGCSDCSVDGDSSTVFTWAYKAQGSRSGTFYLRIGFDIKGNISFKLQICSHASFAKNLVKSCDEIIKYVIAFIDVMHIHGLVINI